MLPSERLERARTLRAALLEEDADWSAPILWRSEFRNILEGCMRRKAISFEQANSLQREAESLLQGAEFEVESSVVLELVRDSDCPAYDCEFIALAMKLDTKMVTMEKSSCGHFRSVLSRLLRADLCGAGLTRTDGSSTQFLPSRAMGLIDHHGLPGALPHRATPITLPAALPAARSVWRRSDADSMSARDFKDPTSDAG